MAHRTFRMALALLIGGILAAAWLLLPYTRAPVQASPSVHYVAPGGNCGGMTPCYASVQAAVNAAAPGDEIRVAAGTYTGVQNYPPLNIPDYFTATQIVAITRNLTIRGGYTTTNWTVSDPAANPTTLDAQGQGRVVCIVGAEVTLEGLRVINGNSTGLGGGRSWRGETLHMGAGFYIISATVTISNSEIADNINPSGSFNVGGGIYARDSRITLLNNSVTRNRGDCNGGVFLENAKGSRIIGNVFQNNSGPGHCYNGGGLFAKGNDIIVSENTFSNNSAYGGGGLSVSGNVIVQENRIVGNQAFHGGGIIIYYDGTPTLKGNLILSNTSNYVGGGICCYGGTPTLLNNVVADNRASSHGAGLFIGWGCSAYLLHNTIARNTGGEGSGIAVRPSVGASTVAVTNTILFSHTVGISVTAGNTVTVDGILWYNTPVTVSQAPGALVVVHHQYTGDPAFGSDGYHISPGSAALNRGVDTGVASDIDGDVRFFGPAPDLGADEWATVTATIAPAASSTFSATTPGFTTTLLIPAGAVTRSIELRYIARAEAGHAPPSDRHFAGQAFDLDAFLDGQPLDPFFFEQPVTMTIDYREGALGPSMETTLLLMRWNGSQWEDAACGDPIRNPAANRLEVPLCRLSRFALFGEAAQRVYLPLVLRNR